MTGHLDEISDLVSSHIFVTNNVDKEELGNWEFDGISIDGVKRLACSTDDSVLLNKAGKWFDRLMEVQHNDTESYIGIFQLILKNFSDGAIYLVNYSIKVECFSRFCHTKLYPEIVQ